MQSFQSSIQKLTSSHCWITGSQNDQSMLDSTCIRRCCGHYHSGSFAEGVHYLLVPLDASQQRVWRGPSFNSWWGMSNEDVSKEMLQDHWWWQGPIYWSEPIRFWVSTLMISLALFQLRVPSIPSIMYHGRPLTSKLHHCICYSDTQNKIRPFRYGCGRFVCS